MSRTSTAIRFDAETHNRLVEVSDQTGMSINWLVNMAVSEFLATLPDNPEVTIARKTDG